MPYSDELEEAGHSSSRKALVALPVLIMVLGLLAYLAAAESFVAMVKSGNEAVAKMAGIHFASRFEAALQTTGAFAKLPGLIEAVQRGDAAMARRRLQVLHESDARIERCFITDAKGRLWADFPVSPEVLGHSFSNREWYQGVSQQWQPYLSGVYLRSAQPQQRVVALAVPIKHGAGPPLAILVCQFSLKNIQKSSAGLGVGPSGSLVILDPDGRVVAHPGLQQEQLGLRSYAELPEIRQMLGAGFHTLEYEDPVYKSRQLATISPIMVLGRTWILVAQQPVAVAYAPLRTLRWRILFAGLLLALGSLSVGRSLHAAGLRQAKLMKALRSANQGLLDEVKQRQGIEKDLLKFQAELEETVRQRTAALAEKEKQYLHAQKMEAVGRLAGGVAHDFNNMLTVIIGQAEMLREGFAPGPEADRVQGILAASERAASLTSQLLAFARRQVIEPKPQDLNQAVRSIDAMLRRLLDENITVELKLSPGLRPVLADQGQLDQILLNLAVNARDAMPSGGRLIFETQMKEVEQPLALRQAMLPPGGYIILSVTDTGQGMQAEVLEHIFEPFFTTKVQGKGTGLGLSMVQGAMEQVGGYVSVESMPGIGSCFRLYFPACKAAYAASEQVNEKPQAAPAARILVVEDESELLQLAELILRREGHQVQACASPLQAMEWAQPQEGDLPLDILLTDLVMPGMSGSELAAAFQNARPGLKVIFMSGYTETHLPNGLGSEFHFIQKPFSPRDLRQKVAEVLGGAAPFRNGLLSGPLIDTW